MPFFTQAYQPTFLDLLREVTAESSSCAPKQAPQCQRRVQTFTPKFDIRETATQYELYGELAGVEQKDVEIEFSDRQTLTVRGHRARQTPAASSSSSPNSSTVEVAEPEKESHNATVEDDFEEVTASDSETATSASTAKDAETPAPVGEKIEGKKEKDEGRYWIAERGVGQFARSFEFQEGIDRAGVKASLKYGVLSIVVPKKAFESKRVEVN